MAEEPKKPAETPEKAPAPEGKKPERSAPEGKKAEKHAPEGKKAEKSAKAPGGDTKKGGAPKGAGEGHVKPLKVRLRERYMSEIVPALMQRLSLENKMAVPRLKKICLNVGFGKAATENQPKVMEQCVQDLTTITGQKAVVTLARKSISNFKVRQGMKIGARVTLRGAVMFEFLDRLVNVAIPRIRDFRGLSPRAFDGHGNYTLGLQEQSVFPEIEGDKVEAVHGMDITICTSARDDKHAYELLKALGMPFRDR
jgi:large subunit ribosomal protein L5